MNQATTQEAERSLDAAESRLGSVASIWRYPVKSMAGEELALSSVTDYGLLGDRAYALVDASTGKVATAKNPRKWPGLFEFHAQFAAAVDPGPPPVRVTLPDGTQVTSGTPEADTVLSQAFGRQVTLEAAAHGDDRRSARETPGRQAEEYWPDIDGLAYRDTVTDFDLPEGTFFDCAVVHVLTTATLNRLRQLYPSGRFETRRFRPNIVVDTPPDLADFTENAWVGRTIQLGDEVRLSITEPCPRCVMTTLEQRDLPKDPGILRTLAQHNSVNAGVYASVVRTGTVRRGDRVNLVA
jgi:uncharacterized protein YcbX